MTNIFFKKKSFKMVHFRARLLLLHARHLGNLFKELQQGFALISQSCFDKFLKNDQNASTTTQSIRPKKILPRKKISNNFVTLKSTSLTMACNKWWWGNEKTTLSRLSLNQKDTGSGVKPVGQF